MLDERKLCVLSASDQAQWDTCPDENISVELVSPWPGVGYANTVNQLHSTALFGIQPSLHAKL